MKDTIFTPRIRLAAFDAEARKMYFCAIILKPMRYFHGRFIPMMVDASLVLSRKKRPLAPDVLNETRT